jgi:hypothetical protein
MGAIIYCDSEIRDSEGERRRAVEPSVGAKQILWWESTCWRLSGFTRVCLGDEGRAVLATKSSLGEVQGRTLGRAAWEGCQCGRWAWGLGPLRASAPRAKLARTSIRPLKYGVPKQRGCFLVESSDLMRLAIGALKTHEGDIWLEERR